MKCIAKLGDLEAPTHVVQCSGTREHAYAISLNSKQYWKRSWFNANAEEDEDKIHKINDMLPDCTELTDCFTGKLNRKLAEYYFKLLGLMTKWFSTFQTLSFFNEFQQEQRHLIWSCFMEQNQPLLVW